MKRIKVLLAMCCMLVLLLPGTAQAVTYNNDVPSGLTLLAWSVNPNNGGKSTSINFLYSGGFNAPMGIDVPFDSSWHSLNDVRPILLAQQNGYGNYLGGSNGSFGTNIHFADNVLAAMKVQNFNPAQVGGADIPPSSTTLSSEQISWLEKVGYSVGSVEQVTPKPTSTPEPTSSPAPQAQTQTISSEPSASQSSQSSSSTPTQQSKVEPSPSKVQSNPEVGETVKTEAGPMTEEMIAANQKLSAENPPDLNPANISIASPSDSETEADSSWYQQSYQWLWVIGGVAILILAGIAGRIIYLKRQVA